MEMADAKRWLLSIPSTDALGSLIAVHVMRINGGSMIEDDLTKIVAKIIDRMQLVGVEIAKLIILDMVRPVIKDGELALCPTEKGINVSNEWRRSRK